MIVLTLLACKGATGDGPTDAGPTMPDLPAPSCLSHSYLPLDDMGELVVTQAAPELSFDPAGVDGLVELLGAPELAPVSYGVDTWRIRYVTQDRGQRVEATAAVIVPRLAQPGPAPLLMWEHFTSGATDICAPSAMGALGLGLPLAWAAKLGVVVVAPDYLGMNGLGAPAEQLHPYVVGEPTAIASLDAARATLRLADEQGLSVTPDPSRTVVWGASQGGHAALWVDRYAPGYAPELTVLGVVAAVPPSDMVALADRGLGSWNDTSETLVAVSTALADWYGLDLDEALVPGLSDAVLEELATTCNVLDPANDLDTLEEVFTPGFLAAPGLWDEAYPDWGCALEADTVRLSPIPRTSGAPVMMVLGEDDTLAWSPPARADAEAFCAQGMAIELVECSGLDHEDAALSTLDAQAAFIADRLAGVPMSAACTLPPPTSCP